MNGNRPSQGKKNRMRKNTEQKIRAANNLFPKNRSPIYLEMLFNCIVDTG
jgi:hypothetical protein